VYICIVVSGAIEKPFGIYNNTCSCIEHLQNNKNTYCRSILDFKSQTTFLIRLHLVITLRNIHNTSKQYWSATK